MNRRAFIATLATAGVVASHAPAAAPVAPAVPVTPEPDTLVSRIIVSIDRRRALGYKSGVIYLSRAGRARVWEELGFDAADGAAYSCLVGVPIVVTPHCRDLGTRDAADFDYVICEMPA